MYGNFGRSKLSYAQILTGTSSIVRNTEIWLLHRIHCWTFHFRFSVSQHSVHNMMSPPILATIWTDCLFARGSLGRTDEEIEKYHELLSTLIQHSHIIFNWMWIKLYVEQSRLSFSVFPFAWNRKCASICVDAAGNRRGVFELIWPISRRTSVTSMYHELLSNVPDSLNNMKTWRRQVCIKAMRSQMLKNNGNFSDIRWLAVTGER